MHKRCKTCDALMRPYAPEDWDECGSCRDESRMSDLKDQLETERARVRVLREALEKLVEASVDSDSAYYGTLATSFVRGIAAEALATPKEQGHE